jgi:Matrixin.
MKKGIIFVLALITFFSISVSSVSAYVTFPFKWDHSNIKYLYENYNTSRGKAYFASGAATWNITNVTLSFGSFSNYDILITETYRTDVVWDGFCTIANSGNFMTRATIQINMAYTATYNNDGALKSVVVHEFGHALGLDENGNTQTVMNRLTWGTKSRYGTYAISSPKQDDKNGIASLY